MKKSKAFLPLVVLIFSVVLFATSGCIFGQQAQTENDGLEIQLRAQASAPMEVSGITLEGVRFELYYKIPVEFFEQYEQTPVSVFFSLNFSEEITGMFGTNGTGATECYLYPEHVDERFRGPIPFEMYTGNLNQEDVARILNSKDLFEVVIQYADGTTHTQTVTLAEEETG